MKELPTINGYTVDERLNEFRKIEYGTEPEFIPFDSEKGEELLLEMKLRKRDAEVFKILKEKDERIYMIEKEFYDDAHSGGFKNLEFYETLTAVEIVEKILDYFLSKDVILQERQTKSKTDHNYNKENYKKCPICRKTIDYHTCGFYHDEIQNIWICACHGPKAVLEDVELKDQDLIASLNAEKEGKEIFFFDKKNH